MHLLMMIVGFLLVFIVNPLIAYFNAYTVGKYWNDIQYSSFWQKTISVSALVQSVIGFSMPILGILLFIGYITKTLTMNQIDLSIDLLWLSIIIPIVGSGILITIESIKEAIRSRSFTNGALAIWNLGATIENIFNMVSNFGSVIKDFEKRSDKEDDSSNLIVVLLVGVALLLSVGGTVLSFNYGKSKSNYS